jgi:WhiB family transcriptional regulator, redox-sensing transcriptional regulator
MQGAIRVQSGNPSQPNRPSRRKGARPPRNLSASGPEPWMWEGACATADPDLFFPRERRDPEIISAKRVCACCPVKDECLQYSLDAREEFGIWGGLDEWERQGLLDKQHGDGGQGVA